jgi:hypothetical protein
MLRVALTQNWLKHSCLPGIYFLFSYTFGFSAHGSATEPCIFCEFIKPTTGRYEFSVQF